MAVIGAVQINKAFCGSTDSVADLMDDVDDELRSNISKVNIGD